MHNLLTGKLDTREYPDPQPNRIVEDPWTAEAYHAAARRLLNDARKPGNDTANMVAAAGVLADLAMTAQPTVVDQVADALRTAMKPKYCKDCGGSIVGGCCDCVN